MEKDSLAGQALVTDQEHRELSLPSAMVQRGLELALHIERRQGLQPLQARREYLVRCQVDALQWLQKEDGSQRLGGSDEPLADAPLYLVLSVDARGVHVACATRHWDFAGMEGNEDRFRLLNALHDLRSFTIPVTSLSLFYHLVSQLAESDLTGGPLSLPHLKKEALKNLSFTLGPSGGAPGYKGPATREANPFYDGDRHCVETVLIYIALLGDPEDDQSLVQKDPPLKLSLVAIDPDGDPDPAASRELYHALLEAADPGSTQGNSHSLAELSQNAPAGISEQKEWQQWAVTHEGQEVKDQGRFESISIHPKEGKLFLIVNVPGSPVRVALWVEDVHGIELGEKEGSFRLDGMKWIQMGETIAFHGRAFKFGWMDPQLNSTEYRYAIIVKVKQKDIRQA